MRILSLFLGLFLLCANARAQTLILLNSSWRYFKGTAEPSAAPGDWRLGSFADGLWASGNTPFYYGETFASGTVLSDMRSNYTSFYLRKSFSVANPAALDRLVIRTLIDDGMIIWINGKEVTPRFAGAPLGEPTRTNVARANIEQQWTTNIVLAADYLVAGANMIAAQVFNSTPTSTDIVFNLAMDSASDREAPTVASVNPAPGLVSELRTITVNFSEPVTGVGAPDFLVNNVPATSVTGSGASWTFSFEQPAFGFVDIRWEPGHQIADLAAPPNVFDSTATNAQWRYELKDTSPPAVLTVNPPSGATVRALTQVDVRFDEVVLGVNAGDLLVNGSAALGVVTNGNLYSFQFPAQAAGAVNVTWAAGHGIRDLATNAFVGSGFVFTVDPNYVAPTVVISELVAGVENDATGLKDDFGELQDWIEIWNTTAAPVNLAGWSLTDDPETPDLWIFPNVTIQAGARMVVFASAKNRTGLTNHTNFKLSLGGEFLGLYNAESPRRLMTGIDYPEQRNDVAYGLDGAGAWQYFGTPTPRAPNGTTTLVGLIPKLKPSVKRGTFDAAFSLAITNEVPGVTIRYTTDGSIPTLSNGSTYGGPLNISATTVLRAVGFRANYLQSETLTESYIFLDQVLRQPNNPPGFPVGATVNGGYPSDYEMDPEIVNDPNYAAQMKAALQALPIISMAIRPYDMWDSVNGIYTHPLSRDNNGTRNWERPCSIEFFTQDGKGFQIDAGVQIQGNAAREPIKTPKHPFRLLFRGDYGPSKLNYQMFPDSPIDTFDTLILRADFNVSWLHWDPQQRQRGQRIRDAWMKDSMRAMGGLASHNRYAHLYINGVYWGIYEPTERPDGSFGAAYFGGEEQDYDVINEGAVIDGDNVVYNQMLALTGMENLSQYNLMKTYLDMPQFIDYMLLHFYVGHTDWFYNKNWYTVRPRNGSSGFKYVPWDGELVLMDPNINKVTATDLPSGLHPKLLASAEYKLEFADRVQKHFFNGGALTPGAVAERYANRTREIALPIIAESARWGDYRRDVHQYSSAPYELYTRNAQWATEQARLTNTYFPNRTATVLAQLRAAGLFPSIDAPRYSLNGGQIAPGYQLSMSGTATIYYTTNGVDPRVYGTGAMSANAQAYAGPVALPASRVVKARSLSGGVWSALMEAKFSTETPRIPVRFTEIMYNPNPPGDAYEYLELQNFGPLPVDVSGWFITGVDFVFPPQTILAPGQIVLLGSSENVPNFRTRYPGVTPFGIFNGQLVNRGERVALVRPDGRTVTSVNFDDEGGWPAEADGVGNSLVEVDPFAEASDPANWRASAQLKGTPGVANPTLAAPIVVINEVFSRSTDTSDFVEIRSLASTSINIGGWTLWKVGNDVKFVFPANTMLGVGSYLVVSCDRFTNAPGFHAAWALDSEGDTLILSDATGARVDARTVGPQAEGLGSGLVNGRWQLGPVTRGLANLAVGELAPASALLINEWVANPLSGEDDWFEVLNTHPTLVVDMRGLYVGSTNQMFEITRPIFVGPGEHVRLFADEGKNFDFKLPAEGGTIRIYDAAGTVLRQQIYSAQTEGLSTGRYPDGTATIIDFPYPTPGTLNTLEFPLALTTTTTALKISWPAMAGAVFQVQSATDFNLQSPWGFVTQMTAASNPVSYEALIGTETKFFRVVRQP